METRNKTRTSGSKRAKRILFCERLFCGVWNNRGYHNGGKCTYNGKKDICTAPEGIACVWSPDVYPDY